MNQLPLLLDKPETKETKKKFEKKLAEWKKKEKDLVPLRIDSRTIFYVSPEKAADEEYVEGLKERLRKFIIT